MASRDIRRTMAPFARRELQQLCELRGEGELYAHGLVDGPDALAARLMSSLTKGIPHGDASDHALRVAAFGSNAPPTSEPLSFLQILTDAYDDFTLQTLTAAGFASMVLERAINPAAGLQDMVEGAAILVAVAVVRYFLLRSPVLSPRLPPLRSLHRHAPLPPSPTFPVPMRASPSTSPTAPSTLSGFCDRSSPSSPCPSAAVRARGGRQQLPEGVPVPRVERRGVRHQGPGRSRGRAVGDIFV